MNIGHVHFLIRLATVYSNKANSEQTADSCLLSSTCQQEGQHVQRQLQSRDTQRRATCRYHLTDNGAPPAFLACKAMQGILRNCSIYSPVSTSLTVLSSIFLSILYTGADALCVLPRQRGKRKQDPSVTAYGETPCSTKKVTTAKLKETRHLYYVFALCV